MTLSREKFILDILKLQQKRSELRSQERSMKGKEKFLNQMPTIAKNNLGSNLSKVLPSHLVPTNIGSLKHTLVPYFHETSFEIGTDPTYGPTFRMEDTFQVSQESAFLLTGISRSFKDGSGAGFGAPLSIDIRDNQSTRQFNDEPISLQHMGYKSCPTSLEVPLLFMPNASVRITLSSWLNADQVFIGKGDQEICFSGYRVPVEDAEFLLDGLIG